MKSLGIAVALVAAPAAFAGTVESPILGGTAASPGQFPSTVVIQVGGGLCTGTLITKDWVMTAAHCVSPSVLQLPNQQAVTNSVRVHFNTVNLSTSSGTVATASDTIPNPGFSINNLGSSDVGLIKLASPVTNVQTVPVNLDAKNAPIGIQVTMVGYGATAQGGGGSIGVEMTVAQKSISCSSVGAGSDSELLCFNQVSGKGKCEGDSGGPSFAMIGGHQVQVGITSFGDQNCAQFGADTRTDAEKDFILKYVPTAGGCEHDADCPMGHTCFAKRCIMTPFSPTGLGSTCTSGADCESMQCATAGDKSYCTMACTVGADNQCPSGLECQSAGGGGACWPSSDDTGCCDTSGAGAPTMLLGIAFVGLIGRRRRR
jgi:trypsin